MKSAPASPTPSLLTGLAITLSVVGVFCWYALRQLEMVKTLQTTTVDRNRKDSLQLLRIQNDLNSLGLAIRDMLDELERYPLEAWRGQFERTRRDLEDAMNRQAQFAPAAADADRREYLRRSMAQFWTSAGQVFEIARAGDPRKARDLIRNSLQAQQAGLTTTVARLLVQNNEAEELAMAQIQAIYAEVERNMYYFFGFVLCAVAGTGLYGIRSNRRVFRSLSQISEQRSGLARKLIAVQEDVLHSIARELHDEFGQILTAIGVMLSRAERRMPATSDFVEEMEAVRRVTQETLERTRSLSQVLHPSILDDAGLEGAIDAYLPVFEKQTGIAVEYEKSGRGPQIDNRIAIHVYRVLQEALSNVARHSQSTRAWVRVRFDPERLRMEVEDHGAGISANGERGIGVIAMRERAELLGGQLDLDRPPQGGTLVRLEVPVRRRDE